jgi:predicted HD phosphohydrolase
MHERATFTRFQDSTEQDWKLIKQAFVPFAQALPDLAHLKLLEEDRGGLPVDRLTHSLQTATLALRDGRDEEYVICALLHDIGDTLAPFNHADLATKILKPFVSEENVWMIEHHTVFQGYYYYHHLGSDRDKRLQFADSPHFDRTAEFCELYDGPAFDPKAKTLPLSEFEPMLRRVMAEPRIKSLLWPKRELAQTT